jgi:uncharacterized protein (TIGR00162 family)
MRISSLNVKSPVLKSPYMICGLPGIGYIAKLSLDFLIKELKADLFKEVYSPFFPPHVLIKEDGTVELMNNSFHYLKGNKSVNDLILLTGNTQALSTEGQYDVSEQILDEAEKHGVAKLFTLAAYVSEKVEDEPKVYGAASTPKLVKELKSYNVTLMDGGSIGGTNGLLFGIAKLRHIPSICLLGETPGYITPSGRSLVDAKAAKAILQVLVKMLNLKVDLTPLDKQAKATKDFIGSLEEMEKKTLEQLAGSQAPPLKERQYYI